MRACCQLRSSLNIIIVIIITINVSMYAVNHGALMSHHFFQLRHIVCFAGVVVVYSENKALNFDDDWLVRRTECLNVSLGVIMGWRC